MVGREQIFPEHDKLKACQKESQACGAFFEWLMEKYTLATPWENGNGYDPVGHVSITSLLADYFEINENELENEKQSMLDAQRFLNTQKT